MCVRVDETWKNRLAGDVYGSRSFGIDMWLEAHDLAVSYADVEWLIDQRCSTHAAAANQQIESQLNYLLTAVITIAVLHPRGSGSQSSKCMQ